MTNKNTLDDILPEGLDENVLDALTTYVTETIQEEVDKHIGLLGGKVVSFIRSSMDMVKEQALAELTEENDMYRDAKLMESFKAMLSLELSEADDKSAISAAVQETSEVAEENELLTDQLQEALEALEEASLSNKVLLDKVHVLQESNTYLREQPQAFEEDINETDESINPSGNAKIFTQPLLEDVLAVLADRTKKENSGTLAVAETENEFLTEASMDLMPKN